SFGSSSPRIDWPAVNDAQIANVHQVWSVRSTSRSRRPRSAYDWVIQRLRTAGSAVPAVRRTEASVSGRRPGIEGHSLTWIRDRVGVAVLAAADITPPIGTRLTRIEWARRRQSGRSGEGLDQAQPAGL